MAGRYSLTIQLADPSLSPFSLGHAAVVINAPNDQMYAGFGPQNTNLSSWLGARSPGKFDSNLVQSGRMPPRDFSNVSGHNSHVTFSIPISQAQAEAARAEISRIDQSGIRYDLFGSRYCTLIVNQIMQAASLGDNLLYSDPSINIKYLSDIERALARDPNTKFVTAGTRNIMPIPEGLRGIQRDYAFVGGGYDTPSERTKRVPSPRRDSGLPDQDNGNRGSSSVPDRPDSFGYRFGNWGSAPAGNSGETTNPFLRGLDEHTTSGSLGSLSPANAPNSSAPTAHGITDNNPVSYFGRGLVGDHSASPWDASSAQASAPASVPSRSQGPLSLNEAYLLYQARLNEARAQASTMGQDTSFDAPLAPAANPDSAGGASAWIAAISGIDPQDPTRFAAQPPDDELRPFVGNGPFPPWTLQRRR